MVWLLPEGGPLSAPGAPGVLLAVTVTGIADVVVVDFESFGVDPNAVDGPALGEGLKTGAAVAPFMPPTAGGTTMVADDGGCTT